jgi:hypothetical protein
MTPQEKVKAGIKQTKAAITAVVRIATADRKAGVYNDSEWATLKEHFNAVDGYIKDAERYAALGDLINADSQRKAAQAVLDYAKQYLIKQKDKE